MSLPKCNISRLVHRLIPKGTSSIILLRCEERIKRQRKRKKGRGKKEEEKGKRKRENGRVEEKNEYENKTENQYEIKMLIRIESRC